MGGPESKDEKLAKITARQAVLIAIITSVTTLVCALVARRNSVEVGPHPNLSGEQTGAQTNQTFSTEPIAAQLPPVRLDQLTSLQSTSILSAYIKIQSIKIYSDASRMATTDSDVRIVANVNGTKYAYPVTHPWLRASQIGGAHIPIEPAPRFIVSFEIQQHDELGPFSPTENNMWIFPTSSMPFSTTFTSHCIRGEMGPSAAYADIDFSVEKE